VLQVRGYDGKPVPARPMGPPKCYPVWFVGTGDIYSDWSAMSVSKVRRALPTQFSYLSSRLRDSPTLTPPRLCHPPYTRTHNTHVPTQVIDGVKLQAQLQAMSEAREFWEYLGVVEAVINRYYQAVLAR